MLLRSSITRSPESINPRGYCRISVSRNAVPLYPIGLKRARIVTVLIPTGIRTWFSSRVNGCRADHVRVTALRDHFFTNIDDETRMRDKHRTTRVASGSRQWQPEATFASETGSMTPGDRCRSRLT